MCYDAFYYQILLDRSIWLNMRNVMLYWFYKHSPLSFSSTIVGNSEAHAETGAFFACEYEWMNSQYSPALMHSYVFCMLLEARLWLTMRNNTCFSFHNHSSSSFSSTIVRTEAHTTGKFTACEYELIHKSKYFHAMMHPIMFCMIQDDAFDWLWEILCLFHFIIIPHRHFHLWQ